MKKTNLYEVHQHDKFLLMEYPMHLVAKTNVHKNLSSFITP